MIEDYIKNFSKIEGWCHPEWYDHLQFINKNFGLRGGVTEIGVHHGKFFIMLNSFTDIKDRSFAIDLFENQELNIDKSGKGNLEIFKKNLEDYDIHKGKNVNIIAGDSLNTEIKIVESIGLNKSKFVSIDGGHTQIHLLNDLKIAEKIVTHTGLVIIDDFLHPKWLGVTEGVFNYLDQKNILVPLAIGFNKLIMCNFSYHQIYLQKLNNSKKQMPLLKGFKISILN